jgi:hypothetical protein
MTKLVWIEFVNGLCRIKDSPYALFFNNARLLTFSFCKEKVRGIESIGAMLSS